MADFSTFLKKLLISNMNIFLKFKILKFEMDILSRKITFYLKNINAVEILVFFHSFVPMALFYLFC